MRLPPTEKCSCYLGKVADSLVLTHHPVTSWITGLSSCDNRKKINLLNLQVDFLARERRPIDLLNSQNIQ